MWNPARRLLAVYIFIIFATLPLLPGVVAAVRQRLGGELLDRTLAVVLVLLVLMPVLRLFRPPRPAAPWPYFSYFALLIGAFLTVRYLASSPIGRIHLAEYALLAILVIRALPGRGALFRYAAAFAAASAIGIIDELVQGLLPNRVYDPYDIALNSAAAALGLLAFAWWKWAFARPGNSC